MPLVALLVISALPVLCLISLTRSFAQSAINRIYKIASTLRTLHDPFYVIVVKKTSTIYCHRDFDRCHRFVPQCPSILTYLLFFDTAGAFVITATFLLFEIGYSQKKTNANPLLHKGQQPVRHAQQLYNAADLTSPYHPLRSARTFSSTTYSWFES